MTSNLKPNSLRLGLILLLCLTIDAQAEVFNIVSDTNCNTSTDGTHSQCQFPEINIKDTEKQRLPIPYETLIKTTTSSACQLDAINSALQVRLGNRKDRFLRYEDLSMDHNRRRILTHPHLYPLGSIAIYPKVDQIFKNTIFPSGCQISLEVKFNRISLKSRLQANDHLATLNIELEKLTQSHAALTELRKQHQALFDHQTLIEKFRNFFKTDDRNLELEILKQRWCSILNPLQTLLSSALPTGSGLESLNLIKNGLETFTQSLEQAIHHAKTPDELHDLFLKANKTAPSPEQDQNPLLF